jgi:hypothetical protein
MISKKWITGALLVGLSLPLVSHAQTQASSKVTGKTANINLIPATTTTSGWQTILTNQIKTSAQKDLFVGASLEVGLFTRTLTRSKLMVTDSSTARAIVQVRVMIDGKPAEPGPVVYGRRSQTLNTTLEGAISSCLTIVTNTDGTQSIVLNPDCVTPEAVELILETMDAASFNFIAPNVPVGTHTVSVQARVDTTGSADQGQYEALATVGKGSMTVESVRLIRADNVVYDVN